MSLKSRITDKFSDDKKYNKKKIHKKPRRTSKRKMSTFVKVVLLLMVIIVVIYFVIQIESIGPILVEQYTSLSASHLHSNSNFDKRLSFVRINEYGVKEIVYGYASEAELEQARQEAADAGIDFEEPQTEPVTQEPLSIDAQQILAKLQNSSSYATKATTMANAYNALVSMGYPPEAGIGLMANIYNEGRYNVVEYAFSRSHAAGFRLPSNGSTIASIADIDYLCNWDSSSQELVSYDATHTVKLGSCGVGGVQWSGGRRIGYLNVLKNYMHTDADVVEQNFLLAEVEYIKQELNLNGSYYTAVVNGLNKVGATADNASAAQWAEAMADYYVIPSGWCGRSHKMEGIGSACQARINTANELVNLLR